MDKHAVSIKWSDEDKSFVASIPGIHGLSALGSTREEALSELKIAAKAYFDSLKKAGKPIPPENKIMPFSGQIRLRMPKSLHTALSFEAEEEGVSLNTYMVTLLSERHIEYKLLKKLSSVERALEAANSNVASDVYNTSKQLRRIEENRKGYRRKKK